jgi:hypothetical protein
MRGVPRGVGREGVVVVEQPGVPLRFDWRWNVLKALMVPWFVLARWRIRVEGLEHVPSQGGAVIAFNHHSYADASCSPGASCTRGSDRCATWRSVRRVRGAGSAG